MVQKRHPSFFFIYINAFISIASFSVMFPLLPAYAKTFNASTTTIGILASMFALAQLVFAPFWGEISDKFGRKAVIAAGLLGMAASFLLFAIAHNLATLFVSRFLQGFFAGAALPASRAYIADRTSKEERVKSMGRLGASLALGFALGPAMGGFLAQNSFALPFFVAATISALNFMFVLALLPESLKEKHSNVSFKRALVNIIDAALEIKGPLAGLYLLAFSWSFLMSNIQVNLPLLSLEKFNLGTDQMGLIFTLMGGVIALTQWGLLTHVSSYLGHEKSIIKGLFIMALGFSLMPFVPSQFFIFALIALIAFGSGVARPLIAALISQRTPKAQGKTMGLAGAYENFGRLVGPLAGGFLFSLSIPLPFLTSSVVVILIITLVLWKFGIYENGA